MYEIGRVYIWQNLREHVGFNGTETTVIGPMEAFEYKGGGQQFYYCETDTVLDDGRALWATRGQLRPKNPPSGEQSILDLLRVPEHESA